MIYSQYFAWEGDKANGNEAKLKAKSEIERKENDFRLPRIKVDLHSWCASAFYAERNIIHNKYKELKQNCNVSTFFVVVRSVLFRLNSRKQNPAFFASFSTTDRAYPPICTSFLCIYTVELYKVNSTIFLRSWKHTRITLSRRRRKSMRNNNNKRITNSSLVVRSRSGTVHI